MAERSLQASVASDDGSTKSSGSYGSPFYADEDLDGLPESIVSGSVGCGNPHAIADLQAGEIVLDLGCGGGLDVLLAARRVGPTGFVYGVDMTDQMLELARINAAKVGRRTWSFAKAR